jgi:hypothetical protein
MTRSWGWDAIFYHIYPLGLCGAPDANDFTSPPVPRLEALAPWSEHACELGCNALYLGPLFESSTHGYDTADMVDLLDPSQRFRAQNGRLRIDVAPPSWARVLM